MAAKKPKKNQSLRNNEYYDTQNRFDELYQASQQGKCFTQLMELITNEENIMLAYRSIKKNKPFSSLWLSMPYTALMDPYIACETGMFPTGWISTSPAHSERHSPITG